jgi:small subunit ribosomal protein S1
MVTRVGKNFVLVALGDAEGLLPTLEVYEIGTEVEVVVVRVDADKQRVTLGYGGVSARWVEASRPFQPGVRVKGRVSSLTKNFAFIGLAEGIQGWLHRDEITWSRRRAKQSLKLGQAVEAVVTEVIFEKQRIMLSMRALTRDPWETVAERYPVGSVVEGWVSGVADYGVFVDVEEGVCGLIHVANWLASEPMESCKKGDVVRVRVMSVSAEEQKLAFAGEAVSERSEGG